MSNDFKNQGQGNQAQKSQNPSMGKGQKDQSSSERNARQEDPSSRVGNNIHKDEPEARSGNMKKEAGNQSTFGSGNKSSQDNRPQDGRKASNA